MDLIKNCQWIREKNEIERKEILERKAEALTLLPQIVDFLVQEDSLISRIILFGSLNEDDKYLRMGFDIDIAIDCSPQKYYHLLSSVQDISRFKIDLIDLNAVKGYFKERILERGKVIYEK